MMMMMIWLLLLLLLLLLLVVVVVVTKEEEEKDEKEEEILSISKTRPKAVHINWSPSEEPIHLHILSTNPWKMFL